MTHLNRVGKVLWFFRWAALSALVVLGAVAITTQSKDLVILTLLLAVLEVGLSFDNAVVNALVLKTMSKKWQDRFLLWGILIAVFGMRLVIPVIIVAVFGGLWPWDAFALAFTDGQHYGEILHNAHWEISGFGGMFLTMVVITFLLEKQDVTWVTWLERRLQQLGQLKSFATLVGLGLTFVVPLLAPADHRFSTLLAMVGGLVTYLAVDMIGDRMESDDDKMVLEGAVKSGAATFIYLEVLDASFSFDGVIGAFALSTNVLIIMAGLGIGAFFVRSLTVYLVRGGKLDELPHLGHAAHYAIGVLAAIMFISMAHEVPEIITGLAGAVLLIIGIVTSVRYNRNNPPQPVENEDPDSESEAAPV
jgi:hypothetical protein